MSETTPTTTTNTEYEFTRDWFHWAPEVWLHVRSLMQSRKDFLEVGAYEGRSTVWTIEHMMEHGGEITVVDTWAGSEEHKIAGDDMTSVEDRFDHNIALVKARFPGRHVDKWKGSSVDVLRTLKGKTFDFIYLDGSHQAKDVMTDACLAWPLLRKDGVLVFDDYMWGDASDVLHRPKLAIDMFTTLFGEEITFIHTGCQVVVRKK